ncbi:MAG: EAL domain-containing protein [Halomonadaceae bacterium]|nr:MAG: EAL domain-containing protein [Halomonadaceae bacterium]
MALGHESNPTSQSEQQSASTHQNTQASQQLLTERLSLLARTIADGVVMTNLDGEVEWLNEGFLHLTGYSTAEIMGKKPGHLLQGPATSRETVVLMREALAMGQGFDVDLLNYHRSGHPYWVHIQCHPICEKAQGLTGFIAIQTDITRRKQAEITLSQFRSTLDQTMDAVFLIDRKQRCFTYVNQGAVNQLGYHRERLMAMEPQSLMLDITKSSSEMTLNRLIRGERKALQFDTLLRCADGSPLAASVSIQYVALEDGSDQFVAIARDISAQKRASKALAVAASVFANSFDGVMIIACDGLVKDVNPAFSRITGFALEEVQGKPPEFFSADLHDDNFYPQVRQAVAENGHWRGEVWSRRKSGDSYPKMLSISQVYDDDGAVSHQVAVFSDISELKNHQAELEAAANYDVLTGLPNRRLLADRLSHALARAERAGETLAVCLLDMDGFKPINDTYGHELGDKVLQEMARRLNQQVRKDDTVARLGGDEFVLLLNGATSEHLFQRLLDAISVPMVLGGITLQPTVSLGITPFPEDLVDSDMLLRHADQAMYQAKEAGKNCFSFFDSSHDAQRRSHRQQFNRLRQALEEEEFVLFYQPQVDMRSGIIIGMEALIRWHHPEQGLLAPAAFLPLIEGSELEQPLGEWVINTAFTQLAAWQAAGRQFPVCINIGANHLLDPRFIACLEQTMVRHSQVAPPMISLEILETTALHDMCEAWEVISHCQELGFKVALDDFGTGFSSLTYFRKLPVDLIKIDQSFIRDMLKDNHDRAIVESVVFMAQKFDRPVLAEGVETDEHARELLAMGCHFMQGYGIARPMPAHEVMGWSANWDATNPYRQNGQN